MAGILMTITNDGLDALVDAQNSGSDEILIDSLGLSDTPFVQAPTLEALPNQFKTLATISGEPVSENIIHLTAYDQSADVYDVSGLGLFLDDGTLFAAYSAASDPVLTKAELAYALFSLDISFDNSVAANITFGNAIFSYPPATEETKGVAELATQPEANAGLEDSRIITPLKLKVLLDVIRDAITQANVDIGINAGDIDTLDNALDALLARTISGSGLVTGGGNLTANRVLNVASANGAEAVAEAIANKALTPASLAGFARSPLQTGYATIPGTGGLIIQHGRFTANANAATAVTFPLAFPTTCHVAVADGALTDVANQDNYVNIRAETITATGFTAYNNHSSHAASYIALGR